MTRYHSGRRAEWKARDYLRAQGYNVIRSAGSKGPVDLVAYKVGTPILFVQVKYTVKAGDGAGSSWIDDNWRKLVNMTAHHELPCCIVAAAFIYRRGTKTPTIVYADAST